MAQTETEPSEQHNAPPPNKPAPKKRNLLLWGAGIAVAVFAIVWGVPAWRYGQSHVSSDDSYVTSDVIQITPRVEGYLAQIYVTDNQHVKAGQVLAVLDDSTFRADVAQDRANLAAAIASAHGAVASTKLTDATGKASITQAIGGITQANGGYGSAIGSVQRTAGGVVNARATTQIARDDIATARSTITQSIAARDQSVSAARLAAAGIQAASAQRNETAKTVLVADATIKTAEAGVDSAIAARRRAGADINSAQAQIVTAQSMVRQTEQNVVAAQANLDKANSDRQREEKLVKGGAISAQDYDAFVNTARTAEAQLAAMRQTVEQAQSTVTQREAELKDAQEAASVADAAIRQARSQVTQAQQQRAQSVEGVNAANAAIRQARAQYAGSQDAIREAEAVIRQNQTKLTSSQDVIPQANSAANEALGALTSAKYDVNTARGKQQQAVGVLQQAHTAPEQLAVSVTNEEAARAKIQQAQATLDSALIALNNTRIVAPVDGVVSRRVALIGQDILQGQPVMALVPSTEMWIVANLKETQMRSVRPGERAEVEVDSLPGRTFYGTVDSIAAGTGSTFALLPPDNATGNFTKVVQRVPVKIVLDQRQKDLNLLRSGLSATATITVR